MLEVSVSLYDTQTQQKESDVNVGCLALTPKYPIPNTSVLEMSPNTSRDRDVSAKGVNLYNTPVLRDKHQTSVSVFTWFTFTWYEISHSMQPQTANHTQVVSPLCSILHTATGNSNRNKVSKELITTVHARLV